MTEALQVLDKVRQRYPAVIEELRGVLPKAAELLPPDISVEQFKASLWLEMRERDLHECSPRSIVAAVIRAATHGLLLGRDAHLLPFRDRRGGKKEATLIPNYFGIIRALERTGKIRKAFAHAVYTGDRFQVDYLSDEFHHEPMLTGQRGHVLCFYGCVLLKDGTRHIEVMTVEEVNRIRDRSRAQEDGPWARDYVAMARKTALKQVAKFVQLTATQQELFEDEDDAQADDAPSTARIHQVIADLYGEAPLPNDQPAYSAPENAPSLLQGTEEVSPVVSAAAEASMGTPEAVEGPLMLKGMA